MAESSIARTSGEGTLDGAGGPPHAAQSISPQMLKARFVGRAPLVGPAVGRCARAVRGAGDIAAVAATTATAAGAGGGATAAAISAPAHFAS